MKCECRLPAEPRSVAAARSFVTEAMIGHAPDTVFRAELLVSELATNCIVHAATAFTVTLTTAGRALRVDVSDDGDGQPVLGSPAADEPHGRGLRLVDALSTKWGIASSPRRAGKTLWFSLLTSPPGARSST
ncbi:ATP-binding protein [uncultured Jatrophihabitans sp.]|uniref:ATP-binding protein n=1 Tax=uncultured Jatrophihabitans sp. TaxID=1610747 RepID=UPI0035C97FCA